MTVKPQTIMITGASSGIGEGLAKAYAAPGTQLHLSGRAKDRLETVAQACRIKGATVETRVIDVTDQMDMIQWITNCNQVKPLDLVIANAGVSGGGLGDKDWDDKARQIFDINMTGLLNTLHPAITVMRKRGCGQIALMSSLAGYRGLASTPAYSSSKVWVKAYGEGLRPNLAKDGIKLSVICPGFVESRITDKNPFHMPMLMTADKAAQIITRDLARNKGIIAFPVPMVFGVWVMSTLPQALAEWISKRLPEK